MFRFLFCFVAIALLAPLAAQADEAPCNLPLARVMKVSMAMDAAGGVNIPATIGGKPVQLLVDTGGLLSMLTPETEDTLDLERKSIDSDIMVSMYGGKKVTSYVKAKDIQLGAWNLSRMNFLTLPTGSLPDDEGGIVAPDLLRIFDVDFDFSNTRLSFFSQNHCPGQVVYWTQDDYAQVPIVSNDGGHIIVEVNLDGKKFRALVDTGADRSVMSLEAAEDFFGFDEKSPLLKDISQSAGRHSQHYPFKVLSMQGVAINNPDLVLVPDEVSKMTWSHWDPDGPKIILGMNVLRQLHLYIAYKEKMLYVTPASAH